MLKNFLAVLVIVVISACSSHHETKVVKQQTKPTCCTPPKDKNHIYSIGEGENMARAKNNGSHNLRKQLLKDLEKAFADKNHILYDENDITLKAISSASKKLCNTLSMRAARIKNSTKYNGKTLVLLKLSKKNLFQYIDIKYKAKLAKIKEEYALAQEKNGIHKYLTLKPAVAIYPELAAVTQLKKNLNPSYDANSDFQMLKNVLDDIIALQQNISFYLISDVNSRIFVPNVQNALQKEGFSLSKTPKSNESLMLMITSKTDNISDYQFLKSKSLVKFNTFDLKKKPIAFKQHTFIGISKKSYDEAKEQAVINANAKIRKLGIFDILGLQ